MDQRPTKEITLPFGKVAVVKEYLIARESNELKKLALKGAKVSAGSDMPQIDELDPEIIEAGEKKLIEFLVVSYEGSSENIYERLLNERSEVYNDLLIQCSQIQRGNFDQAK